MRDTRGTRGRAHRCPSLFFVSEGGARLPAPFGYAKLRKKNDMCKKINVFNIPNKIN